MLNKAKWDLVVEFRLVGLFRMAYIGDIVNLIG